MQFSVTSEVALKELHILATRKHSSAIVGHKNRLFSVRCPSLCALRFNHFEHRQTAQPGDTVNANYPDITAKSWRRPREMV